MQLPGSKQAMRDRFRTAQEIRVKEESLAWYLLRGVEEELQRAFGD